MEEKKQFPLARRSVFTSRNKAIFQNLDFLLAEKNVQIIEYCFKQTENWFPLAGMKNFFKNTLLLDEETTYFDRNI